MGIHNIMSNALKANWCIVDDFQLYIHNAKVEMKVADMQPQDVLDLCAISVDTPQLSSDVTPTLVAGTYRIHNTKFQPFTFSVTFRDVAGLQLKEYFTDIWMKQQLEYFDDIKTEVRLSTNQTEIFKSDDCLISSISQSQFDNANTQVSEFTVEFLSPHYSNSKVHDFGKYGAKGS